MKHILLLLAFAAPAWAETCPDLPDYSDELTTLIEAARSAPDEQAGRPISDQMWQIWLRAPDAAAQEVLDRGMRQRNNFDLIGAVATFDQLVAYCPDYAEGYNQRAFSNFLGGNYEAALDDLDAALALSPRHVAAQSGRALTLMNLGRRAEARLQLLAAVENNPWLSERALLAKGAALGPNGEDI
ncbi:hypothetical protein [uncultured Tateyamaria sp.]|uniref:tetratricopeptide repeat protein n=1 Tax=uncultured Tateyamaria sp. TaxID=455651 RepID=UPI0026091FD8|nr:hypothetical protein [uncultured Tateyamaria sp.]